MRSLGAGQSLESRGGCESQQEEEEYVPSEICSSLNCSDALSLCWSPCPSISWTLSTTAPPPQDSSIAANARKQDFAREEGSERTFVEVVLVSLSSLASSEHVVKLVHQAAPLNRRRGRGRVVPTVLGLLGGGVVGDVGEGVEEVHGYGRWGLFELV